MKILVLALFLLIGTSYSYGKPRANINDYVDLLLKDAKEYMQSHGMDPLSIPNFVRSFSAEDLIGITWHGELVLNNGTAKDLSTVYRSGDVDLGYQNKTMYLTAEMGFKDIKFSYNFSAKIMNIGPTGYINGQGDDVIMGFKAKVDLKNETAELVELKIVSVGLVDIQIKGLGTVLDWMLDGVTKVVVDLFKGPILEKLEEVLFDVMQDVIGSIDIGDYLPP